MKYTEPHACDWLDMMLELVRNEEIIQGLLRNSTIEGDLRDFRSLDLHLQFPIPNFLIFYMTNVPF